MRTSVRNGNRWRLFGRSSHTCAVVLLVAACHPSRGCAVSEFRLAPESRLPVWFSTPAGVERNDLEVTMTSHSPLFSEARTATFELRTKQGQLLKRVVAQKRGTESLILQPDPGSGSRPYPRYEILTAEGMLDVVVHRRLEPLFRVTDDPDVRRRLGVD